MFPDPKVRATHFLEIIFLLSSVLDKVDYFKNDSLRDQQKRPSYRGYPIKGVISTIDTVKIRDSALGLSGFVSFFWWAYLRGGLSKENL